MKIPFPFYIFFLLVRDFLYFISHSEWVNCNIFFLNLVFHGRNHSSKQQSFKGKYFLVLHLSLFNKMVSLLGLHLGFSSCDYL